MLDRLARLDDVDLAAVVEVVDDAMLRDIGVLERPLSGRLVAADADKLHEGCGQPW